LQPELFLSLLLKSKCLIGNSSVGIRECAFLGVPVVNIGDRQRSRLRAENVIDVQQDADTISAAAKSQIVTGRYAQSNIYGVGDSGERIANLLSTEQLGFEKQIAY
jgi:UDP-N-acetylglucosamine 2-epimerase